MAQVRTDPLALRAVLRPITVITSARLDQRLGTQITLVSETFQQTGSFKFRAAYNVAMQVPHKLILTASSGNFGQALACACQSLNKSCLVVMPNTSAQVKVQSVRDYGGQVDLIEVTQTSRHARVEELAKQYPEAYVASAYDDPLVIAGNATLGEEMARLKGPYDAVLAPVGGGGLTAGILTGLRAAGSNIPVWGAEPLLANDAARSLRAGRIITNAGEPQTIADGVRTLSLGQHNWAVLREGLAGIIEVNEERIGEAVRLLFTLANLKAEPTGALAVAAVLTEPGRFRSQSIICVVSGGNVDADLFGRILTSAS